jgi:DNA-binding transcriptional regulator/RsmH inhibitor MraZ
MAEEFYYGKYDRELYANRLNLPNNIVETIHLRNGENLSFLATPLDYGERKCLSIIDHRSIEKMNELLLEQGNTNNIISSKDLETRLQRNTLLLPLEARRNANLVKEVTIIGFMDYFEIWDRSEWEKYKDQYKGEYDLHLAQFMEKIQATE